MRKIKFVKGNYYHIFNRGVEKRNIFNNDSDKWRFLQGMFIFNDEDVSSNLLFHCRLWQHCKLVESMKSFRSQFLECQKENWILKEKCVVCGKELLMCTIFGGQCFSKKCLLMRKEIITVMIIITHDNQEYFCRTPEEIEIFIDNYMRLEV